MALQGNAGGTGMIVADANVIVYLAIEGGQTAAAQGFVSSEPQWITSPLWRFEFASAVTTMIRAGMLDRSNALKAFHQAEQLAHGREQGINQDRVIEMAVRYAISAYDAQYIALALANDTKCVTSDGPLLHKAPDITVALLTYSK